MACRVLQMKILLAFQCLIISATSFKMVSDINYENALEYVLTEIFEELDTSECEAMKAEVMEHALDLLDGFFDFVEDEELELDLNLIKKLHQEVSAERLQSFVDNIFGKESEVANQIKKANFSAIRDRTLQLLKKYIGEDFPSRRKRASEDGSNGDAAELFKDLFQTFQSGKKDDDKPKLEETTKGFELRDLSDTVNLEKSPELEAGIRARPRSDPSPSTGLSRKRNREPRPTSNEDDDSGKKESSFMDRIRDFSDMVYGTADELMGLVGEKNEKMSNYGKKELEQGRSSMKKYRNDFGKFLKDYGNDLVDLMKSFNSQMRDIAG